jgi:long-chain fatty acid transport protein
MKLIHRSIVLTVGFLLSVLVLAVPRLVADEFTFYETSARAAGMGGAFTARADDASALFYNPAGLAFQGGIRLKTNLLFGRRTVTAVLPEGSRTYRSNPSEIEGAHAVSWQALKGLSLGIGLFSPFSFQTRWLGTWEAGDASRLAKARAVSIRSALAVELFKGFAVSVGMDVVSSRLRWSHNLLFNMETYPLPEDASVESRHELSGHGLGFVAGALWKIAPAVQFGARYQSRMKVDYEGDNVFYVGWDMSTVRVPDPYEGLISVGELMDRFYRPQHVTGRQTFPEEIACGVALTPFPRLSLYADIQWDRWSEFGPWEFRSVLPDDELSTEFTPVYQEFYGIAPNYGTQGVDLGLKDTVKIKTGLEFRPGRSLAVRAGYVRSRSSVDDAHLSPIYPDLTANVYTFGFGFDGPVFSIFNEEERINDLSFDLFIRYSSAAGATSTLPGFEIAYEANRFIFGVGVGLVF